ncbi:MAG: choice-of-anchor L domain-containing protein [Bacteroidetes bacterium]|nr:choice-of-anchor L domain-containing protein [Bacteroidota bacterium]
MLEFDLQVLSDSVEFKYSFGSEEYLEWVSAGYNDVFAFYISGPGIAGQQNIALVPGTATPVSIDNVNDISNSAYYVDNGDGFTAPQNGSNYYIQYDGFTTVLTAKRKNLQPCQTYHLRLAIADAGDGILDSGVFLEANSLTSNGVTVDDASTNDPNTSNAMEGCVNGKIVFRIDNPIPTPVTVTYQIGGTATNGTDYQNIPNTITIPAGDSTATLNIVSLTDNLPEGTETVAIYLLNVCNNQPYDSAVMQIFDPFPVRTMNDTSICAGDQVTLASQGLGVYSWSPSSTLSSATALSPIATPSVTTTYIITSNIGSCVSRDTVTVNVIAPPFSVSAGNDVYSCAGGAVALNAVVSGNPVNGQAFQYLWSPAAGLSSTTTPATNATPAGAATYIIQVSSGNCRVTDTVNVSVGQLSITTNSTNETCFGYQDGTAGVTSALGSSPINYTWSNSATTATLTGLSGGNYTVTVSDANNCSATASLIVGSTNPIYFTQPTVTNVSCYNGNDGLVTISANGGAGSLSYLWNNGSTSTTISLLTANSYTISATDVNGCNADTTILITQPTQLNEAVQFNNVSCNGSANGSIDITVTGGIAPYSYLWNDGTVTQDRLNIGPGNYAVTITDLNNCSGNLSFTINEPNPMVLTAAATDALCNGTNTDSINLNVNGGTFPYNYLWSNNATTQDISQLVAGSYSVVVTDANNCTAGNTQTVQQPAVLSVSLTKTDLQCYGDNTGSVSSVVTGGTPGYTYLWSNSASAALINTIAAGNYSVTVNDLQLCQASASITVAEPSELLLNISYSDVVCHGGNSGQCSVAASGGTPGYNYLWSNSTTTPVNSNLPVGNYTVTVTDLNTCSASAAATLTEPALLSAVLASLPPKCVGGNDGIINTTMIGGVAPYNFTLNASGNTLANNGSGSFPGLSSGSYQVNVTDGNNCTTTSSVNILSPYPDEFTFASTPTSCFGPNYNDGSLPLPRFLR